MIITIKKGHPRNQQCGDWLEDKYGNTSIIVSDMDIDSFIAVAIHELLEKRLCDKADITDMQVTQFDAQFENERTSCGHEAADEAGDDPRAPYHDQHQAATFVERAVCAALGLDWVQHCVNVERAIK